MPNPSPARTIAKRGRPRRLALQQILDAAVTVGLDKLTMSAVAEQLGVAKPVLYNYVSSRDELVEMAAIRLIRQKQRPGDHGQPWHCYVLEYARLQFKQLIADGQLLETWLQGGYRPGVEIDSAEEWLAVLTARGFSSSQAVFLRRAVSQVLVGAAAHYRHSEALRQAGVPRSQSARQAVLDSPADETPLLHRAIDEFASEPTPMNWEPTLLLLLHGVASAVRSGKDLNDLLAFEDLDLNLLHSHGA